MFFEDFSPGDRFTTGSRTLSEPEIIGFAQRWDRQFFHLDPEAANLDEATRVLRPVSVEETDVTRRDHRTGAYQRPTGQLGGTSSKAMAIRASRSSC